MTFDFEEVKKHPYLIGGAILGGAVFLYLILHRGGASAAGSSGIDPTLASLYGEEAQAQAQQSQLNTQLSAAQLQANTVSQANVLTSGVDLAQIAANKDVSELNINTTGAVQEQTLTDQLQATNDTLNAQVNIAGLTTTEQEQANLYQFSVLSQGLNLQNNELQANKEIALSAIGAAGGGGGGTLGTIASIAGIAAAFL